MTSRLRDSVDALAGAADEFHNAAQTRGSYLASPEALDSMQEALQVLSAGWYAMAADAASGMAGRDPARGKLSREQEVRLMGALHDVAAAFARCARACRDGRSAVAPAVAGSRSELSWFASTRPPNEQVA